jgi:hypothetical protein
MTCKIERPSPKVLFDTIKSMFSNNVIGGANIITESNEWYVVGNDYAMAEQFYSISEQAWKERDPRYACCENLIDIAAKDGVYPLPARFANGYIQMTGEPDAALVSPIEFVVGGQRYITAGPVPFALDAQGQAVVRVRALEPGVAGNLSSTTLTGTLVTTMTDVDTRVNVFGGQFCGGAPEEGCEQFRTRYLDRMKYKPNFNLDWVKQKIMEWPCVSSVCERAGSCCELDDVPDYIGGVDCGRPIRLYVLFDGTFPCGLAPGEIIEEIDEWMFGAVKGIGQGEAPWGVTGQLYAATAAMVDVVVDGLACTTPGTANEIRQRVVEFVGRICPSEPLYVRDLQVIISQVMGSTSAFDVLIQNRDDGSFINACGDAEPSCDKRICLNELSFTNPAASR